MQVYTIGFLILFPLLASLLLLVTSNDKARAAIASCSAVIIAGASIFLAVTYLGRGLVYISVTPMIAETVGYVALAVDVALAVYVICKGVIYRKPLAVVLAALQGCIVVWFEMTHVSQIAISNYLYVDSLSIIMALIIGIIGSGICVYAVGYMRDHVKVHPEQKDMRRTFFAIMYAFLAGMYLLVFSNDLMWLFAAWEITTVCSFALIAYTRTEEAINNSFRQITLNLIGGLCFIIALVLIGLTDGILELDVLISIGNNVALILPITLLCVAGFTKAAQMPFHSWLLGAMVAPTPTSALLHSSTMVKAGVFLLIKLAPCFGFNIPGITVMLVGGCSFLLCSLMAIAQSNAKRVLAYSTIANLGLITACAGTGLPAGIWAAIFLLIFHAATKSLLFLCVGTAEHHIGSRNIEDMDSLFERMPVLSRFMIFGMLVMFVAPFGMLVSKWAALQAFVDSGNLILIMLLAFGSAATFFFWAKWIGKLSAFTDGQEDVEKTVWKSEWFSISLMAVLSAACCIGLPFISSDLVIPYLGTLFHSQELLTITGGNLMFVAIVSLVIIIMLIALPTKTSKRRVGVYLSGATVDSRDREFKNSFSQPEVATQSNWYLDGMFGEKRLDKFAVWIGILLICGGVVTAIVQMILRGVM